MRVGITNHQRKEKKLGEIHVPIFNDEYKVIVGWGSWGVREKILRKNGYYSADPHIPGRGICFRNKLCHPLILLPNRPVTPEEIGVLTHEAVHAVDAIMNHIGQKKVPDEIYASSIEAVVRITLESRVR
jgi:hypothetical protein